MTIPALFDLTGRTALVTGGSRGLGREMLRGFAAAGADVVVASRRLESCEQVAAELTEEFGVRAHAFGVHVGKWATLDDFVTQVYERVGRVDVLVNNAGLSPAYDSLTSLTEELFDKVIDVNLKGAFRLAALIGERMQADGGGSIINISSSGAVRPRPQFAPYAAAKAGLNAVTIALAHAYGPTVRVNAIQAGTFMTDVNKGWDPEAFARRYATFALQRPAQPAEIVGTALYLASDASSYTTGALLTADGGQP